MALNATELNIIYKLIKSLESKNCQVKILSLGYPDLLVTGNHIEKILGINSKEVKIRHDSEQIAKGHKREELKECIFESIDLFRLIGVDLKIVDINQWTGNEIKLNLNEQVSEEYFDMFHIIIDPGTLEHIFNIAQVIKNICHMLKIGGYIYHQNPLCHINHGFYSISPTFYNDFYNINGFKIKQLKRFVKGFDEFGLEPELAEVHPYNTMLDIPQPATLSIVVEKIKSCIIEWPIQQIYATNKSYHKRPDIKKKIDKLIWYFDTKGKRLFLTVIRRLTEKEIIDYEIFLYLIDEMIKKKIYFTLHDCLLIWHSKNTNNNLELIQTIENICKAVEQNTIYSEVLIKKQLFNEAIDILLANVKICKDHLETYNALSIAYYHNGDNLKASDYIKKALELAPENEDIKLNSTLIMNTDFHRIVDSVTSIL